MENNELVCVAEPEQSKEKDGRGRSFREQWKDKEYRRKFLYSMSISGSFLVLGMCVGQLGPTFLDLQIITNTGVEKASGFFTAGSVGYLVGSLMCGLLYSRLNPYLLMLFTILAIGTAMGTTALCSIYELMLFNRFITGYFGGVLDTAGNTLHIVLWGTEGEGLMQFLHFCFAFGGVLSPLYSEPFLAPKLKKNDTSASESITNVTSLYNVSTSTPDPPRETDVKYAFLISFSLAIVFAIPFVFIYISDARKQRKEKDKTDSNTRNQRKLPRRTMLFTLLLICFFYHVYCCVEDTFASFLMTFMVKEYDSVSKSKGAFVTAVYWASFATARFSMVFLCRIFSSLQLLMMCTSLMVVSYVAFFISAHFAVVNALIVFAALAGLSMSAVFPAGLSWTEAEFIKISGPISSAILVSSSLGTMVNPLLLGYLMDTVSNMWFIYLLLGETLLFSLLFVVLLVFSRCYLNKKYGRMGESVDIVDIKPSCQETFLSDEPPTQGENGRC